MSRFDRVILDRFLADLGRRVEGLTPEIPPPGVPARERPIVWVVGTPRSGTTLAATVLRHTLDLGYVTNVAARFPTNPVVGMMLAETLRVHAPDSGGPEFDIGRTRGLDGDHEFGMFWTRWLRLDETPDGSHRLGDAQRDAVDIEGLRATLHAMIGVVDHPLLLRNVICGLNASLLARVHEQSVFVEVRRDPIDTAWSILRCRRERAGGEENWWSLRPSNWRRCAEAPTPIEQVAGQVAGIRADLAEERARVEAAGGRWVTLDYAALCADPCASARRVADAAWGGAIETRTDAPAVDTLTARRPAIDPSDRAALRSAFDALGVTTDDP